MIGFSTVALSRRGESVLRSRCCEIAIMLVGDITALVFGIMVRQRYWMVTVSGSLVDLKLSGVSVHWCQGDILKVEENWGIQFVVLMTIPYEVRSGNAAT